MIGTGRAIDSSRKTGLFAVAGFLACTAFYLPLAAGAGNYPAGGPRPAPPMQSAAVPPRLPPPTKSIAVPDSVPVADTDDWRYRPTLRRGYDAREKPLTTPDCTLGLAPTTTAVPTTEPPALPDRPPLPVPPDVSLPAMRAPIAPKPPLAWRAKAYALSEKASATATAGTISRTFDRTVEDVFSAILSACPAAGMAIESLNSSSGDLLLIFPDDPTGTSKVIISVKAAAPARTSVDGTVVPCGRAARQAALEKLFSNIDLTLSRNGAT